MNNRLLIGTVVLAGLYWIVGAVMPNPYLSSAMSLTLLVSGAITAAIYASPTYRVVFRQQRDDAEYGTYSHLGVFGVMLLSLGSFYVGSFGFLWVVLGQPENWLGTPASGFGRGMMTAGFALMSFSPLATRSVERMPNMIWIVLLSSLALFMAFLAGTRVPALPEDDAARFHLMHGEDRPSCPSDRSVWVGSGKAYHTTASRYRAMVIPKHCYRSEDEARAEGFVPPKR